jgi:hypothetical protein
MMKEKKAIVLAYQDAHNAHDVELALSFFAPNIRFEMTGLWVKQGLEDVRALEEWDAALANQLTFGDLRIRNARLECEAKETNDWFKLVGIDEVFYDSIKFEFDNGLITHIRAKISPKGEMAVDKVVNGVMRWALEACPEEVENLMPRGLFNYGREEAHKWLALLKDWQDQKE